MVPFGNFTVRGAASAARTDAPESTSITAPAAGNDKPTAAQSALNWRRLSKCLSISRSLRAQDNEF
jgi:hypothetical protein